MKLFRRCNLLSVVAVLVMIVTFAGCHKSDNAINPAPAVSGLMAFNLATDKVVDVALEGRPITSLPLSFTSYTGYYTSVYSGSRFIQSFDYNSHSSLDSASYDFIPQKYYSLFVVGANGRYRNLIVNDNFDTLASGKVYVRYINAIPDSSAPAFTISSNGSIVTNKTGGFGSISEFASVPPGDVTISVNNGGTINKSRTINLEQQKIYTVLLLGVPGSTGNDSLQIRYVENGTVSQSVQKTSSVSAGGTN